MKQMCQGAQKIYYTILQSSVKRDSSTSSNCPKVKLNKNNKMTTI